MWVWLRVWSVFVATRGKRHSGRVAVEAVVLAGQVGASDAAHLDRFGHKVDGGGDDFKDAVCIVTRNKDRVLVIPMRPRCKGRYTGGVSLVGGIERPRPVARGIVVNDNNFLRSAVAHNVVARRVPLDVGKELHNVKRNGNARQTKITSCGHGRAKRLEREGRKLGSANVMVVCPCCNAGHELSILNLFQSF